MIMLRDSVLCIKKYLQYGSGMGFKKVSAKPC